MWEREERGVVEQDADTSTAEINAAEVMNRCQPESDRRSSRFSVGGVTFRIVGLQPCALLGRAG